jgi:CRP/FNR family transcriptional regulator, cyclic AMP receptor protein
MEWALLASLPDDERDQFLGLARHRSFGRHDVLCRAGEPEESVHLIETGRLSVQVSQPDGDTAMINLLGPGDYFGELSLFSEHRRRTATIVALEPTTSLSISGSSFLALCARRPSLQSTLTTLLAHRVDQLSQRLLESLYDTVDRRLHHRLLDLSESYAASGGGGAIPLTQTQLAGLTGGTRPTINKVLRRLADEGTISLSRGQVVVLDPARLRELVG